MRSRQTHIGDKRLWVISKQNLLPCVTALTIECPRFLSRRMCNAAKYSTTLVPNQQQHKAGVSQMTTANSKPTCSLPSHIPPPSHCCCRCVATAALATRSP
jgi:hypothetical protein